MASPVCRLLPPCSHEEAEKTVKQENLRLFELEIFKEVKTTYPNAEMIPFQKRHVATNLNDFDLRKTIGGLASVLKSEYKGMPGLESVAVFYFQHKCRAMIFTSVDWPEL
jgi:hypothetical protein